MFNYIFFIFAKANSVKIIAPPIKMENDMVSDINIYPKINVSNGVRTTVINAYI